MTERRKEPIGELDRNMSIDGETLGDAGLRWLTPVDEARVRVDGFAWFERDRLFRRLPVRPEQPISAAVDKLADHTAGGQLRFRTDSSRLRIRVRLAGPATMDHMPATGQCGFDCYIEREGRLRFYRTARFDPGQDRYECGFYDGWTGGMREIVLYFPLYQGVKEIVLGLDSDASVQVPQSFPDERRIIFYGTSITQGGCANRPGMAYPNILSRRFPLEIINLGFSGNGRGEPEMASLIAEIERPACLVVDYDANCPSAEEMARTLPEFIRTYRRRHPDVPILVLSKPCYAEEAFHEELREKCLAKRQAQAEIVDRLRLAGDRRIFFQDGGALFGSDFADGTVDGVHPTDQGFARIADRLTPILAELIGITPYDL
ncbi:SGNH/GDSL hydrolase family protein [Paenibacillus antri]|nr:SGNH/GDSL hydrolase family protein [Paenibacillus antri]